MSVLYYCYCGYTQREPSGSRVPPPRCREVAHLSEPRADYPVMTPVVVLPVEHLTVVRESLGVYRERRHEAGEDALADAATAALDALGPSAQEPPEEQES